MIYKVKDYRKKRGITRTKEANERTRPVCHQEKVESRINTWDVQKNMQLGKSEGIVIQGDSA